MITKKGVLYGILCLLMIPICYQVAVHLRLWESNLLENLFSLWGMYLLRIAEGLLCGVFILVMRLINRQLVTSCKAGYWIAVFAVVINLLVGMLPAVGILPEIGNFSLYYFELPVYVFLLITLLLFIVMETRFIGKEGKTNEKKRLV